MYDSIAHLYFFSKPFVRRSILLSFNIYTQFYTADLFPTTDRKCLYIDDTLPIELHCPRNERRVYITAAVQIGKFRKSLDLLPLKFSSWLLACIYALGGFPSSHPFTENFLCCHWKVKYSLKPWSRISLSTERNMDINAMKQVLYQIW